jgi:conjugal transfer pilus assembly protein TraK
MKNKILVLAMACVCISAHAADTYVYPDSSKAVMLSSENPNRINCADGDINDMVYPEDYPLAARAKADNLYASFKKLQQPDGSSKLVEKKFTLHVVCGGEVFTMEVTPVTGKGKLIRLGDPASQQLKANAKILREKSEDEIIADLLYASYHNNLPPNYTISSKTTVLPPIFAGLNIVQVRTVSLNGIGLVLKEYIVEGTPGSIIPPKMFIEAGANFSTKMRGVSVKPERLPENGKARLFILETKL